ncbi:hypothetical protein VTL71DRAFT_5992 [Oculimacula yallundae]|uniref:Uncharacterized protein n=1 Tax=Oculimacula yallundae TaxID=86028 RepID=A0ABR4BZ38_9HELO
MDIASQTRGTPLEPSLACSGLPGTELRVAFRFTTTRIPGPPGDRARRIADDFATLNLGRSFTWDRDHIHFPSNFDSEEKISLWMLVDFNIEEQNSDIDSILTQYWKVGYDGGTASFKHRDYKGARFIRMFKWGGRVEEWEFRLNKRAEKAGVRHIKDANQNVSY